MDNNETPDAIVKEIRSLVQEARKYPRDVEITTADAEDWADRLEVAIARGRNARINDIHNALYAATRLPGNAAAMREALVRVLAAYKSGAIHTCAECYRDEWDDELGDLKASVDAALAAPARNCDRFATAYEAIKAWDGGLDTAEDIVRMVTWLLGGAE